MAITSTGSFIAKSDKVAGTSRIFTTDNANLASGKIGVLVIALDNTGTTDTNSTEVSSVTDAAGNTWTKLREFRNGNGSAGAGCTVSIWKTQASASLGSGANLTVNFANSVTAKAVSGWVFTVGGGNDLSSNGTPQDLANDAADAGSMTLGSLVNGEYCWFRGIAAEMSSPSLTPTTNFTAISSVGTSGGGGASGPSLLPLLGVGGPTVAGADDSNMSAMGEFRITTSTTQTSDPTTSAVDQSSILLALKETAGGG